MCNCVWVDACVGVRWIISSLSGKHIQFGGGLESEIFLQTLKFMLHTQITDGVSIIVMFQELVTFELGHSLEIL